MILKCPVKRTVVIITDGVRDLADIRLAGFQEMFGLLHFHIENIVPEIGPCFGLEVNGEVRGAQIHMSRHVFGLYLLIHVVLDKLFGIQNNAVFPFLQILINQVCILGKQPGCPFFYLPECGHLVNRHVWKFCEQVDIVLYLFPEGVLHMHMPRIKLGGGMGT